MSQKPTLSFTLIGHNELGHLRELLPSLSFADEIIYVDCESRDTSLKFAESLGCKTFLRPNETNLNLNKSFAIQQAHSEWVFYIDPDERISENLKEEILESIIHPVNFSAFKMPRRNYYFGKWLKYGSQYPDIQLRLFQNGTARFPNLHVHEKLMVNGKVGMLQHDLLHFPYATISQYLMKFNFYTSFEANYLFSQNIQPTILFCAKYLFYYPSNRFFRRYFLKFGFRDGWVGFFAAFFDAVNYIVRYLKFLEKTHEKKLPKN